MLVQTAGAPSSVRLRDRFLRTLSLAILVVVTFWRLWPGVDSTPFQRDEARWIGNSALLREWRDPFGSSWQDEGYQNIHGTIDESNRRRSQPPLAMYLFGLSLLIQGEGLPSTGYWNMNEGTEWNTAHGNMPSDAQLRAARRTNVVVALLTVIALYFIGMELLNWIAGITTGLVYALHPLVLSTSTRAWSDPLLVLCIVLAIAAMAHFGRKPSIARATIAGVLLGLGAATKLSPLLLAAAIGCGGLLTLGWVLVRRVGANSREFTTGVGLLSIPLSAYLTFVAVYPYLWTDPISHTKAMFDFRSLSFDLQAIGSPQARVLDFPDAVSRTGVQLTDRYSVGGFLAQLLHHHTGIGVPSWMSDLDLILAAIGWLMLAALIIQRRYELETVLPLALMAGQVGLIVVAFRLDYSRYLLPIVPAIALGIGSVTGLSWAQLEKWFRCTVAARESARRLTVSASWASARWKRH